MKKWCGALCEARPLGLSTLTLSAIIAGCGVGRTDTAPPPSPTGAFDKFSGSQVDRSKWRSLELVFSIGSLELRIREYFGDGNSDPTQPHSQTTTLRKKLLRSTSSILFLACVAGALSACGTTEKSMMDNGKAALPGDELRAVLTSGELDYRSSSGSMSSATFKNDGTASVSWGSGGDSGVWRMNGNSFCAKWKEIRGGQEKCFRVYKTATNEFTAFGADGVMTGVFTSKK